LRKEKRFISVLGITIFLGELLARLSPSEGVKFFEWLIHNNRIALACRLIERWPPKSMDEDVFGALLRAHRPTPNEDQVWRSIERLCLTHWSLLWLHVQD